MTSCPWCPLLWGGSPPARGGRGGRWGRGWCLPRYPGSPGGLLSWSCAPRPWPRPVWTSADCARGPSGWGPRPELAHSAWDTLLSLAKLFCRYLPFNHFVEPPDGSNAPMIRLMKRSLRKLFNRWGRATVSTWNYSNVDFWKDRYHFLLKQIRKVIKMAFPLPPVPCSSIVCQCSF